MSSSDPSLQPFIDRLTARSVLNEEEKRAILDLPTRQSDIRARHDFVHIDEEVSHCCYVVSGLVARVGQTANGARQTTAFHIPGDMADLHSAVRPVGLGGMNALCPATILRVPHAAVRGLVARYPAIAEAFWRDSMLDAAVLMQWVVNVGRRDAQTRIAHLLCEMAVRYGADREVVTDYPLQVTQEQLADAVAVTAIHVNRCLKTFREEEVVTLKGGRVQIADWDRLVRLGEFDANYLIADTRPDRQRRLLSAV